MQTMLMLSCTAWFSHKRFDVQIIKVGKSKALAAQWNISSRWRLLGIQNVVQDHKVVVQAGLHSVFLKCGYWLFTIVERIIQSLNFIRQTIISSYERKNKLWCSNASGTRCLFWFQHVLQIQPFPTLLKHAIIINKNNKRKEIFIIIIWFEFSQSFENLIYQYCEAQLQLPNHFYGLIFTVAGKRPFVLNRLAMTSLIMINLIANKLRQITSKSEYFTHVIRNWCCLSREGKEKKDSWGGEGGAPSVVHPRP